MSTISSPALSRSAERLAVAALTLAAFAFALNAQVLGALSPFITAELGEDAPGQLIKAVTRGSALGSLVFLPFVDRIGRRPPIILGTALFVLASLGHLAVDSLAMLTLMRTISGFCGGVVFMVSAAMVADLVPYERRGAAMGLFNLSIFLALPVGMPLAVTFANRGQWRAVFAIQAAVSGLALLGMLKTLPSGLGRDGQMLQWRTLTAPMVVPALISVLIYTGAFFTAVQFVGIWLDRAGVLPKEQHAWLWVAFGVGSALGSGWLTRASDRVGKRTFVLATTAVVGAMLFVLPHVGSLLALGAVGAPLALCAAARSSAMMALVSNLGTAQTRGTLMALRATAVNVGMGAISTVGDWVNRTAGYPALLRVSAATVIASLLLVLLFVRETGDSGARS